ncbi:MAG: sterol desaturase family protein [Casimicrobium sp.]
MDRRFLVFALGVILLVALVEAVVLMRSKHGYDWREFGATMANLVARLAVGVVLPVSLASPLFALAWEQRVFTVPLNSAFALFALFIGQEFCYYWYHRASHRIRWFWTNHSVHHSPNDLTLAAALRIGVFGKLIGATVFFLPLVWLGFSPRVVLAALAINLLYQFWVHAKWIPKLGVLECVLNTPSAHRVHHAANVEYLDANYGGVLIVFDRMFGTYVAERSDLPIRYGLVKPQTSYNPLRVETREWLSLFRDLRGARSLRAMIGYLFGPPGWRPDGAGETTDALRAKV